MYQIFKDELHLINLKLHFKEPSYFVNSQVSNEFYNSSTTLLCIQNQEMRFQFSPARHAQTKFRIRMQMCRGEKQKGELHFEIVLEKTGFKFERFFKIFRKIELYD